MSSASTDMLLLANLDIIIHIIEGMTQYLLFLDLFDQSGIFGWKYENWTKIWMYYTFWTKQAEWE